MKTYLAYSLKYFLLFAIPSLFGLCILSKQLLLIMTRPEFVAQGSLVLPIVAVGVFFSVCTVPSLHGFLPLRRERG